MDRIEFARLKEIHSMRVRKNPDIESSSVDKEKSRKQLEADIAAFLAGGGTIEILPPAEFLSRM